MLMNVFVDERAGFQGQQMLAFELESEPDIFDPYSLHRGCCFINLNFNRGLARSTEVYPAVVIHRLVVGPDQQGRICRKSFNPKTARRIGCRRFQDGHSAPEPDDLQVDTPGHNSRIGPVHQFSFDNPAPLGVETAADRDQNEPENPQPAKQAAHGGIYD